MKLRDFDYTVNTSLALNRTTWWLIIFLSFKSVKYVAGKSLDSKQLQEGARITHYFSPVFTRARLIRNGRKRCTCKITQEYIFIPKMLIRSSPLFNIISFGWFRDDLVNLLVRPVVEHVACIGVYCTLSYVHCKDYLNTCCSVVFLDTYHIFA